MWLLKNVVTLVVVIGVSSLATNPPSTTEPYPTTSPAFTTSPSLTTTASATPLFTTSPASTTSHSLTSATPSETQAEVKEPQEAYVLPSVSIRQVETSAVVQEVDKDWSDDYVYSEEEYDGNDDIRPGEEYLPFAHNHSETLILEEFQSNVPEAVHHKKDVIVNKDNLIPLLKTISLAYTHKENPSYSDLVKAGGISAFKTGLKYLGKDKLGHDLLTMAKKLTTVLDDDEAEDESSEVLSELAEEFLAKHRFKLVIPESFLLHQMELEEFLSTRMQHEVEGRSVTSNKELSISMPRADPTVTTLLCEFLLFLYSKMLVDLKCTS